MTEFLQFVDKLRERFPIHVEIAYSRVVDWYISVKRYRCADEYPDNAPRSSNDAILCQVQDCDMELCFAKAHVALKEWLMEHEGGY